MPAEDGEKVPQGKGAGPNGLSLVPLRFPCLVAVVWHQMPPVLSGNCSGLLMLDASRMGTTRVQGLQPPQHLTWDSSSCSNHCL